METNQLPTDKINNINLRLIDSLNFSNIYNYIRNDPSYEKLKRQFAVFISGIIGYTQNKKFHESLNFFEKLGLLSKTKEQYHYFKTGIKEQTTMAAILLLADVVPYLIQTYSNKKEASKVIKFITSSLAYINQEPTPLIQGRIQSFCRSYNYKYNIEEIKSIFDKYSIDSFPDFPKIPDSLYDVKHSLYQLIVSISDLKDPKVVERASQVGELLGENYIDIEETINNAEPNLELFSDKAVFEKVSIMSLFNDLISDFNYVAQAADYSGNSDPFKQQREKHKKIVIKGGAAVTLGALTLFTGPVGDVLIAASLPVINTVINKEMDVDTAIEIHNRFKKLRSDLDNTNKGDKKNGKDKE